MATGDKTIIAKKSYVDTELALKADQGTTYTKAEVDTGLGTKQDTLSSGTNIKSINGTSLLGSGDIVTPTTTVNNTLTSTSTTEALSAAQGRLLAASLEETKQQAVAMALVLGG